MEKVYWLTGKNKGVWRWECSVVVAYVAASLVLGASGGRWQSAGLRTLSVRPMPRDSSRWQRHDGKRWRPKCAHEDCDVRATFGLPAFGKALWCGKAGHGDEGKKDLVSKRCEVVGCGGLARFALPHQDDMAIVKTRWCAKVGHGPLRKENVRDKRCEQEGCHILASFGLYLPLEHGAYSKKRWCCKVGHGPQDKVDVTNKRCVKKEMKKKALQHNATHCNTLQDTSTHCKTLQHTATQDTN